MSSLSPGWKLFRIACVLQMILIAYLCIQALGRLFYGRFAFAHFIEITCYILTFMFLYMGLTLLNDHYPNTPLSDKQRRFFNLLFLVNVLLIAYFFGHVVSLWRFIMPVASIAEAPFTSLLTFTLPLLIMLLFFLLHLAFIAGMYLLRRSIHENTLRNWYQQFGEDQPQQP